MEQMVSERFARVELRLSEAEIAEAQNGGLAWGVYRLHIRKPIAAEDECQQ